MDIIAHWLAFQWSKLHSRSFIYLGFVLLLTLLARLTSVFATKYRLMLLSCSRTDQHGSRIIYYLSVPYSNTCRDLGQNRVTQDLNNKTLWMLLPRYVVVMRGIGALFKGRPVGRYPETGYIVTNHSSIWDILYYTIYYLLKNLFFVYQGFVC